LVIGYRKSRLQSVAGQLSSAGFGRHTEGVYMANDQFSIVSIAEIQAMTEKHPKKA